MTQAQAYVHSQQHRAGYHQERDKKGNIIREIPIDFADPADYTNDSGWLEQAVHIWRASGTLFPPTPDELRWRDRVWDSECIKWRQMVEFYLEYDQRPEQLKDGEENWKKMAERG